MKDMPSALDGFNYSAEQNRRELQEERELQERREERKARREEKERLKKVNVAKQSAATVNAAIVKLISAATQLDAFYPLHDAEFPALAGLRPVLKKLLDDITPPDLPPVKCEPDDGDEDPEPTLG